MRSLSGEYHRCTYDLHAGLSSVQVPDFDQLPLIGMAATLAIHLKGLGEVPYELLRRGDSSIYSLRLHTSSVSIREHP